MKSLPSVPWVPIEVTRVTEIHMHNCSTRLKRRKDKPGEGMERIQVTFDFW